MANRTHTGFLLVMLVAGLASWRAGQSVADSAIDGPTTAATLFGAALKTNAEPKTDNHYGGSDTISVRIEFA